MDKDLHNLAGEAKFYRNVGHSMRRAISLASQDSEYTYDDVNWAFFRRFCES